ncbi:MAG TPA: PIN domain-containing protein [Acidimicrobiales bacterium]
MIFVDTSFWVAVHNRRDNRHEEATPLMRRHERSQLVTTNHIRGEAWTFLRRRENHTRAVGFLDALDQSARLRLVTVTKEAEERALAWLRRHDEREYSFVDATSFMVMQSLRIREALAFDGDFTAAGFHELRL